MNIAIVEGRITDHIKLEKTYSGTEWCRITLAIDRPVTKDKNGNKREKVTDFPRVILWGNHAKFVATYCEKGKRINVVGPIETGKYTNKNGDTIYTTEIRAEKVEIIDWKDAGARAGNQNSQQAQPQAAPAPAAAPGPADYGPAPEATADYGDYGSVNSCESYF